MSLHMLLWSFTFSLAYDFNNKIGRLWNGYAPPKPRIHSSDRSRSSTYMVLVGASVLVMVMSRMLVFQFWSLPAFFRSFYLAEHARHPDSRRKKKKIISSTKTPNEEGISGWYQTWARFNSKSNPTQIKLSTMGLCVEGRLRWDSSAKLYSMTHGLTLDSVKVARWWAHTPGFRSPTVHELLIC